MTPSPSDPDPIPEFGIATPGTHYILRPGGYALIFNPAGEIAVVATPFGLALPGGGQNPGETPEQAAIRETREECGLLISLGNPIGIADELVFANDEATYYRKRCTFFLANLIQKVGAGEPDHRLHWLSVERAARELFHESQRWAVTRMADS